MFLCYFFLSSLRVEDFFHLYLHHHTSAQRLLHRCSTNKKRRMVMSTSTHTYSNSSYYAGYDPSGYWYRKGRPNELITPEFFLPALLGLITFLYCPLSKRWAQHKALYTLLSHLSTAITLWGKWSSETLSHLPKVTQLQSAVANPKP